MGTVRRIVSRHEGVRDMSIGIGINSGEMVVGNIGCEQMTDYTVLGHNVNVGARLCGQAGKNQVLISEDTFELVRKDFKCREVGDISVKGVSDPLRVYEVLDYA